MQLDNFAEFRFEIDDDGTGKLIVRVSSEGFSGESSAWFNPNQLVEFANKLNKIGISQQPYPELAGGYWNSSRDGPSILEHPHVIIRVYSFGKFGRAGVYIRLANPLASNDRPEHQHILQAELTVLITWELEEFAADLIKLSRGEIERARLATMNGGSANP